MKKIIIILILFVASACANDVNKENIEVYYRYTGDFISLVDQRKEPVNKEFKIDYTLQLENFNPVEEVFKKYNSQFSEGNDKYKHIMITKSTIVYEVIDNTRKEVTVDDIRDSRELEVWIKPYSLEEYMIEAVEINIIR